MHEYVVINNFDTKAKYHYVLSDLPLHLTLSNVLLSNMTPKQFVECIQTLATAYNRFDVVAKSREKFGKGEDIQVTEVTKTSMLQKLHQDILDTLGDKTTLKWPEFGKNNYRPHVTDQPCGKAKDGDRLSVDNLTCVEIKDSDVFVHGVYELG